MLRDMVIGALAILGTQLVVAAAFVGLGLVVRRAFGLGTVALRDVFIAFWVGLAAVMLFLLCWSFVFPVGGTALAIVLVAGLAGLARCASTLRLIPDREPWCRSPLLLTLAALSALWLANLCRGPMMNTDTGLYHLQGILWAESLPTVPGLANLFGPLGFNNASFLYDAMLDTGPWENRAQHVANGLLLQVLLWQGLVGLVRIMPSTGRERMVAVFDAPLIVPAADMALTDWVSSFVTDLPAIAVTLVAASQALSLLLTEEGDDPREIAWRLVTVAVLLSIAVTFKLSTAIFAAGAGMLCGGWWLLRQRSTPTRSTASTVAR
ncbi:MAG: LIC_10190 family membrane protein [Gemmatimonadota bacterium]